MYDIKTGTTSPLTVPYPLGEPTASQMHHIIHTQWATTQKQEERGINREEGLIDTDKERNDKRQTEGTGEIRK